MRSFQKGFPFRVLDVEVAVRRESGRKVAITGLVSLGPRWRALDLRRRVVGD
jgi:hypothetical protein